MTLPHAGQRGTILYNVQYDTRRYCTRDQIQGPLKLKREKTVMDLPLIRRKAGAGHCLSDSIIEFWITRGK